MPFYRLVLIGLALAPAAGVFGTAMILIWWDLAYPGFFRGSLFARSMIFLPTSLFIGSTWGSVFALPVTGLVLPSMRTLLPGSGTLSLILFVSLSAISGFVSQVIIWEIFQPAWTSSLLLRTPVFYGTFGSLSATAAGILYFFLTNRSTRSYDERPLEHP